MCGLLVEIGEKASAELFAEALLSMAHRGPDAEDTTEHNYNDKKVILGHRRLSIIDTDQRSNQPMSSICGRFQIVFNGEIYNFRQIKDKHLSDQSMSTESDTEVLLNSFINHGSMIFDELVGMYAVAIYDSKEGVLTVARDPFGIKPMYIFNDNERLIFSSEIKGLQGLNVKPLVDKNQLRQFLAHGFLFEPDCGFSNIQKVLPGTATKFSVDSFEILETYKFKAKTEISQRSNNLEEMKDLVTSSIKSHLISDVPVCNLLSGGVDSSIVTVTVPDCKNFTTLTTADLEDPNSDINFLREQKKSGAFDVNEVSLRAYEDPNDLLKAIEKSINTVEEISSDLTIISIDNVSEAIAKEGYKVVLNGTGADEIFLGYPKYKIFILWIWMRKFRLNKIIGFLIPPLSHKLLRLKAGIQSDNYTDFYERISGYFSKEELESVAGPNEFNKDLRTLKPRSFQKEFNDLINLEINGFLSRNLLLLDKGLMRHSLEGRVPYITSDLFSAVYGSAISEHIDLIKTKKILRKTLSGTFLSAANYRAKRPFHPRFNKALEEFNFDEYTQSFQGNLSSYLDQDAARKIFKEDRKPFLKRQILIMTVAWLNRYV